MSKLDTCGIEVSAKELVVSLRRLEDLEPLRNFTNTPEGHTFAPAPGQLPGCFPHRLTTSLTGQL
jgi:hypothetical protein